MKLKLTLTLIITAAVATGIEASSESKTTASAIQQEAKQTAIVAAEQRSCAKCSKRDNLKFCGRCGKVSYCSRECQLADLTIHRNACVKKTESADNKDNKAAASNSSSSSQQAVYEQTVLSEDKQFIAGITNNSGVTIFQRVGDTVKHLWTYDFHLFKEITKLYFKQETSGPVICIECSFHDRDGIGKYTFPINGPTGILQLSQKPLRGPLTTSYVPRKESAS